MQKHERQARAVAQREAAAYGWQVTLEDTTGPKKRLRLRDGKRLDRVKFVSSSPRDVTQELDQTRQWVRRVAREIRCAR